MASAIMVVFFQDVSGESPVYTWLLRLMSRQPRAFAKCVVRIRQLAASGHQLRRPAADYLRDGIYELRAREGGVNYRILYAFHGQEIAILLNSMTKEDRVPPNEIERALERLKRFREAPSRHTCRKELPDA
jgi:hypothetical protein